MAAAPRPLKKVRKGYFSLEDLEVAAPRPDPCRIVFHNPFRLSTASAGALDGRRSMEPANISGAMTAKIAGASLAGRQG